MTDYTELKRLAEAAQYENCEFQHELVAATKAFFVGCIPEQILALIAEKESAHKHWQNESNNVQVLVAEVARLKAENEALRNAFRPLLAHWDDLKAGESVNVDAARAAMGKGDQS